MCISLAPVIQTYFSCTSRILWLSNRPQGTCLSINNVRFWQKRTGWRAVRSESDDMPEAKWTDTRKARLPLICKWELCIYTSGTKSPPRKNLGLQRARCWSCSGHGFSEDSSEPSYRLLRKVIWVQLLFPWNTPGTAILLVSVRSTAILTFICPETFFTFLAEGPF